jgi:hypothetical protein
VLEVGPVGAVGKMLLRVIVLRADTGSFDGVRLAPHFAQDDDTSKQTKTFTTESPFGFAQGRLQHGENLGME